MIKILDVKYEPTLIQESLLLAEGLPSDSSIIEVLNTIFLVYHVLTRDVLNYRSVMIKHKLGYRESVDYLHGMFKHRMTWDECAELFLLIRSIEG